MTKSATSKKQRQVSGPARRASTIKPRARSRTPRTVLAITCIAGVAVVGLGGLRVFQWLRPAPPVVLPAHPDQIEPQVAKLVQQYAERVWAAPRSAEAHATLGLVYEANKMWYEAEACFGRALQLEPGQCLPAHHRAIMLRSLGEFDAALQAWRTLVQRHPEFAPAHVRIGNALLEAGAPAEAAAAFQRAVDLLPDAAEPFVGLAEARLKQGDYSGAISAGETATRLAPRYRMAHYVLGTAYRAVRRSEAAERELTLGSPALDQPLADEWTARLNELAANLSDQIGSAMDFVDAGQPDVGIRLLERALATRPGEVQIMSNLGTAYMMSGQVEKARDVLLRAEKSNNQAFATYINLAACHLELKRYSEALRYADRAIELAPTMGQAHLVRGRILVRLERLEEALVAFKTAAHLDARYADSYLEMGDACVRLRRYADARQHYEAALKMMPAHVPLRVSLCGVYLNLNDLEKAAAMLKVAKELAPEHPNVKELEKELNRRQRAG